MGAPGLDFETWDARLAALAVRASLANPPRRISDANPPSQYSAIYQHDLIPA
jgi:hypothetical protein